VAHRIIDLAEEPSRLHVKLDQLIVEQAARAHASIPLRDIAVVVVSHPQVTFSHAVLAGLAANGGMLVVCNEKRLPSGMMIPLEGHFTQSRVFAAQASAKAPVRKRLWRQLVQAKITAQAELLERLHGDDFGLRLLRPLVRSGDPSNVEARAASRYWERLFGDPMFRRDRDADDQNVLLNYGYAVLRAVVARALVAAGLHPSLGLHHHNKYNAYCLADDLMEPFRPKVDRVVAERFGRGEVFELTPAVKREIVAAVAGRSHLDGESRTMFDVAAKAARSMVEAFEGSRDSLSLPESIFHESDAEIGV
jgi:CRISPR-associated protein Cas1